MLLGRYHDHLPRLPLDLPGNDGSNVAVEFIVDTGFDGYLNCTDDLILPSHFTGHNSSMTRQNRVWQGRPARQESRDCNSRRPR